MKKLKDDELKKVDGGSTKTVVNKQTFGSSNRSRTLGSNFSTSSSRNISRRSTRRN